MKTCFCPGCKTGYRSTWKTNRKIPSLFRCPKNMIEEWNKAIPRADRKLTEKSVVCALHFKKGDVITEDKFTLFDGNIFQQDRGRARLRKGAIPCIFPNLPRYLSHDKKKRKTPNVRKGCRKTFREVEIELKMDDLEISETEDISISFNDLKSKSSEFQILSSWSSTVTDDFIALLFWNKTVIEKWIIISHNLDVKVFIQGIETSLGEDFKISTFESIFGFMKKVQKTKICKGAIVKGEKCMGYLEDNVHKKQEGICQNCRAEVESEYKSYTTSPPN